MNSTLLPSRHLIFDTTQIPMGRRFMLKFLDFAAWGGWLFLWLPLLNSVYDLSFASNSLLNGFLNALGFGIVLLLAILVLFMAWTQLQVKSAVSLRRGLDRARDILHIDQLAASFSLKKEALSDWQDSQVMVAHHSEDTGWLEHIDALPQLSDRFYPLSEMAIIIKPD
jgi:poly-beta-1,6-N-acetyl-D-glucosamine biosynthesis protein PgaD